MKTQQVRCALLWCVIAAFGCGCAATNDSLKSFDPSKKYLFYLHGKIIEDKGLNAVHPTYGRYEYMGIINEFSKNGYQVISEQRLSGTDAAKYAVIVADQVKQLLAAGVPAEHIAVTGFSKGGAITLHTAAVLKNPHIRYVVMAGCGTGQFSRSFKKIKKISNSLQGRILSIYDAGDGEGGSCMTAFMRSEGGLVYPT